MTNTFWIVLLLTVSAGSLVAGWCIRGIMETAKEMPPCIPTPDIVYRWLTTMDLEETSKILYPLVKSVYFGRRTIHRCPARKGEVTEKQNVS
ncbi:MAG: hypothetical protein COX19_09800 [Desulfobacterales bacterium CG23_combo_of_CG06-09_8_20_14_all_51_8]|nr:MAG: hypothetical protein COX19_09800 [Desulfobacterales bacterium CG23_combo_of_CG06-09_8_20_14_all_51_8]